MFKSTLIVLILILLCFALNPIESSSLAIAPNLAETSGITRISMPDDNQFRVAGQVGGPTQAVDIFDNYACVGVGYRFVILDITNPNALHEIGVTKSFGYYVEDIAVSGNHAYIAAGGAGVYIVDISNPSCPTIIGSYDTQGYAEALAVSGSYVFVADGPGGLRIIDVTNPTNPVERSSVYSLNYLFDVAIEGDSAYLAAAGAGLLIANISNPTKPIEEGYLDTPGYAYGIAVSGNTACIADGWGGLRIIDVSKSVEPKEVGFYDTQGWAFNVAITGNKAFVNDACYGLSIVDISAPASPLEAGSFELRTRDTPSLPVSLILDGNLAYVADRNQGLHILDISQPVQIARIGFYTPMGFADDVVLTGNYACVAAGYHGLRIIDISRPDYPREIGFYDTEDYALSVAAHGDYVYIGTTSSLHIVSITEPSHPERMYPIIDEKDKRHFLNGSPIQDVFVYQDIVYLVDEWGLALVDVYNPRSPVVLSFLDLHGNESAISATFGVAADGNIACVAQENKGLAIVDVSDPYNPELITYYKPTITGNTVDVVLEGNIAYVHGANTLSVIDITDPAHPKDKGSYQQSSETSTQRPQRLALADSRIYIANGGAGLLTMEAAHPNNLVSEETVPLPGGYATGIAADKDIIAVACGEGGLFVVQPPSAISASSNHVTTISMLPNVGYSVPDQLIETKKDSRDSPLTPSSAGKLTSTTVGNTLTVTSVADSGPGTLRNALEEAGSGDAIVFDPNVFPPENPTLIDLTAGLPDLKRGNITIDASNVGVVLNGHDLPPCAGLHIASDYNVIKGLQILNFHNGIMITGAHNIIGGDRNTGNGPLGEGNLISGNKLVGIDITGISALDNTIIGNLIGTDLTGRDIWANGETGVFLGDGASHNKIGGTEPEHRNVISGNGRAQVSFMRQANGNILVGNYIGTDITGQAGIQAGRYGVSMELGAFNNIVQDNVINSSGKAVLIYDYGSWCNEFIGNLIGVTADGKTGLSNGGGFLVGESFNRIGGGGTQEGNVISLAQLKSGVHISRSNVTDVIVAGNRIGVDKTETTALVDSWVAWARRILSILPDALYRRFAGGAGITLLGGTHHCFIGGTTPGECNVIGNSYCEGVFLHGAGVDYNFVSGNRILRNGGYGIQLRNVRGNFVCNNSFTGNNRHNIQVMAAQDNVIVENNFQSIGCYDSTDANFWDFDGTGNYWRRNKGEDDNGDGISDVPYRVPSKGVDNYPLMEPH